MAIVHANWIATENAKIKEVIVVHAWAPLDASSNSQAWTHGDVSRDVHKGKIIP